MIEVHIVMAGEYSDKKVVGVYSEKEKADAFVKEFNKAECGWSQEEFDDDTRERSYGKAWTFPVPLDTPVAVTAGAWEVAIDEKGVVEEFQWQEWHKSTDQAYANRHNSRFYGYGTTKELARRSAEELRRAVLTGSLVSGG